MSLELCPTGEMTGDLLTKPNHVYIFKIFRDLIMTVMPQIDPSNENRVTERNIKLRKLSKIKKISG